MRNPKVMYTGVRSLAVLCIIFLAAVLQAGDSLRSQLNLQETEETFLLNGSKNFSQAQLLRHICELTAEGMFNEDLGDRVETIRKIQYGLLLEKQLQGPAAETFAFNFFAARVIAKVDPHYSLEFYRKATRILGEVPHIEPSQAFTMLTSRAGVHASLMETDSAIAYFRKAIVAAKSDSYSAEASSRNNLGVYYYELGRYDSAQVYFQVALEMVIRDGKTQVGLYSAILDNLAQMDLLRGNYHAALKTFRYNDSAYLQRAVHNKYVPNKVRLLDVMRKLGLGGIGGEITALDDFIRKYRLYIHPADVLDFYLLAGNYFHSTGHYDRSNLFREKYIHWTDSLNEAKSEQLRVLTQSLLKLEELSFEQELKARQLEADKVQIRLKAAQRMVLVSAVAAVVIITLLVLYFRMRRQELSAQKQFAESELRNKVMEAQLIEKELALKKKDLTTLVLHNTQVHDSNLRMIDRLQGITHHREDMEKEIRSLLLDLQSQNMVADRAMLLQSNIDSLNEEFYQKLRMRFPNLSKAEAELCGFLRINLSSKDISVLKNVGAPSVKTSKNRLRKKLGISPEDDLYEFIKSI